MTQKLPIHENGNFWVADEGNGLFRVFEVCGVASYRRGTFHFSSDPAKARSMAIADCDRRAAHRESWRPLAAQDPEPGVCPCGAYYRSSIDQQRQACGQCAAAA
jgi:hypothetical protein